MHPRSTRCFHVHTMSGSEVHTGKWEEVRVHECVNASVGANTRVCARKIDYKSHNPELTYQNRNTRRYNLHSSHRPMGISSKDHLEIQDEIPKLGISEVGELGCSVKLKWRWSHLRWHHIFAAHRVTSRCSSHIQTTAPFCSICRSSRGWKPIVKRNKCVMF